MKRGDWTGIRGIPAQDMAMWESMGPITDRSEEHVGSSDLAVAQFRRMMVAAARKFREGGPAIDFIVNLDAWKALPKPYQAALEAAAAESNVHMLAKYDALNTQAIKRLIGSGVKLHAYPPEVMRAAYLAATQYYEETARTNPRFAKAYGSMRAFRNEVVPWHSLAEGRFDAFMQATMRAAQKK